ncbi:hypothetical protein DFH09DRAFT_1302994 [Mycena vulgaris]|nr:hypothetical protein DFH09DRAFT_1302994 [Mycena vulgaris]
MYPYLLPKAHPVPPDIASPAAKYLPTSQTARNPNNCGSSARRKHLSNTELPGVAALPLRVIYDLYLLDGDAAPDRSTELIWLMGVQLPGWSGRTRRASLGRGAHGHHSHSHAHLGLSDGHNHANSNPAPAANALDAHAQQQDALHPEQPDAGLWPAGVPCGVLRAGVMHISRGVRAHPQSGGFEASSIAIAIRFLLQGHFLTLTRLSVFDSVFSQLRRQRRLARLLARLRVLHLFQRVAQHRLQLDVDVVLGDEEEVMAAAGAGDGDGRDEGVDE